MEDPLHLSQSLSQGSFVDIFDLLSILFLKISSNYVIATLKHIKNMNQIHDNIMYWRFGNSVHFRCLTQYTRTNHNVRTNNGGKNPEYSGIHIRCRCIMLYICFCPLLYMTPCLVSVSFAQKGKYSQTLPPLINWFLDRSFITRLSPSKIILQL